MTIDEGQIVVVGTLTEPVVPDDAPAPLKAGAEAGRIARFREATRPHRIHIAREAEHKFELPVTWGAATGGTTQTFTPGGSGRRQAKEGEEPKNVMIAARRAAMRRWSRRFAFGGPRAWRRHGWYAWHGDVQSF